jgi:Cu(I)/Ag(I) efflux system membrane protein CusA/SilA
MEGKLFSPLAWTKTFILLIDAFLAITLTPVLISFFLKGRKLKPKAPIPLQEHWKEFTRLYLNGV